MRSLLNSVFTARASGCAIKSQYLSPRLALAPPGGEAYQGGMNLFDILFLVAIAAVTVTLGFGLKTLFTEGPEARSRSNKLMRLRVALQAAAVVLLCLGMWWRSAHGG